MLKYANILKLSKEFSTGIVGTAAVDKSAEPETHGADSKWWWYNSVSNPDSLPAFQLKPQNTYRTSSQSIAALGNNNPRTYPSPSPVKDYNGTVYNLMGRYLGGIGRYIAGGKAEPGQDTRIFKYRLGDLGNRIAANVAANQFKLPAIGQAGFEQAAQPAYDWYARDRKAAYDARWQQLFYGANTKHDFNRLNEARKSGFIPPVFLPNMLSSDVKNTYFPFRNPNDYLYGLIDKSNRRSFYSPVNDIGFVYPQAWHGDGLGVFLEELLGHPETRRVYGQGKRLNILTGEDIHPDDAVKKGLPYESDADEFLRAVYLAKQYTPFQKTVDRNGNITYTKPKFDLNWLLNYTNPKGAPSSADLGPIANAIREMWRDGKLSQDQLANIQFLIEMADNRQQVDLNVLPA